MSGLFLISDTTKMIFPFIMIFLIILIYSPNDYMTSNNFFLILLKILNMTIPFTYIKKSKKLVMIILMYFLMINFSSLFLDFSSIFADSDITFSWTLIMIFSLVINYTYFKMNFIIMQVSLKKIPLHLMSFLILVEMLSLMIKPMTLIIRLVVNLVTGHLILELISMMNFLPCFFMNLIMELMEIIVSIIQALVYNLLIIFYSKD